MNPPEGQLRQTAVGLFLLLAVSYGYFSPSALWNENSRFDLTRSLVERGRLDIDPYHVNTEDKAFRAGHYYSDKAPAASWLGALGYGAFYAFRKLTGKPLPKQWITHPKGSPSPKTGRPLTGPLLGYNGAYYRGLAMANLTANVLPAAAALAFLFLLLARRYGQGPALFASLTFGLASPWWPYATLLYGHVLAGSCLLLAFLATVWHRRPNGWRLALVGHLLGWAVAAEYPAALPAALLGLLALARSKNRLRSAGLLLAGALPVLAALAAYHTACFGAPWRLGYSFLVEPTFRAGMSQGFFGLRRPSLEIALRLLAGPHRGLLLASPVLALVAAGLPAWWKARRAEALVAAAGFSGLLLLNSSYYMWDGGAACCPRHLLAGLALLAPALAPALPAGSSRLAQLARGAAYGVAGLSALQMLAITSVGPEPPLAVASPLADYYWPHFASGQLAETVGSTNIGIMAGLSGLASLLPLLVFWLLGGAWLLLSRNEG